MDWPVATVLLGTLGTLAVGILKWMPRRDGAGNGEFGNGRIYARATDLAEFRARLISRGQSAPVYSSAANARRAIVLLPLPEGPTTRPICQSSATSGSST